MTFVHCDIFMATQWAPGRLHSKRKIRVFLFQEEYGHYTAQAQESVLNSGARSNVFLISGR